MDLTKILKLFPTTPPKKKSIPVETVVVTIPKIPTPPPPLPDKGITPIETSYGFEII